MRFSASIIAIASAFVYQGCKSGADETATDAMMDHLNGNFGESWTDEQKKKYSELAAMKPEDCQAKVVPSVEAIIKSAELTKKLTDPAKVAIELVKKITDDAKRAEASKGMATEVCTTLSGYKADDDKKAKAATGAGGAPAAAPAAGASPAAGSGTASRNPKQGGN
jgi:hypothetical protein